MAATGLTVQLTVVLQRPAFKLDHWQNSFLARFFARFESQGPLSTSSRLDRFSTTSENPPVQSVSLIAIQISAYTTGLAEFQRVSVLELVLCFGLRAKEGLLDLEDVRWCDIEYEMKRSGLLGWLSLLRDFGVGVEVQVREGMLLLIIYIYVLFTV